MGDITWKLKPAQLDMFERVTSMNGLKYVIKCSRRLGKSYFLCATAIMLCLSKPYVMVRYAAPTNKSLNKFIHPIMRQILEDCPDDLRPQWYGSNGCYRFGNGSEIHLAGVNNDNADSLRGTYADLFIVDEAGFVDDLKYLIDDVALPQFLDPNGKVVEGRRLLISGSPARTPAHEFAGVSREAELRGNYSHYDIYSGGYPEATIKTFAEEVGGEHTSTWKREYLAMDVVDENFALVPEWKPEYIQEPFKDEFFCYYHKYLGLDIGVRDLTVCLYAHYDFQKATLYIHQETVLSGPEMTTERLARSVKAQELRLFGENAKIQKRISDIDLLLLNDLRSLHNLYFIPADKGKLEEMVNLVRIWVNAGRVIVSPRCKQLIGCLSYGIWNDKRTDFDRTPQYGHFDALAALMYLIRSVDDRINPIPVNYGKSPDDHFLPLDEKPKNNVDKLRKAFGVK